MSLSKEDKIFIYTTIALATKISVTHAYLDAIQSVFNGEKMEQLSKHQQTEILKNTSKRFDDSTKELNDFILKTLEEDN